MEERESALVAFARGTAGHTWGVDPLCDEVLLAAAGNGMQRAGGVEDQDRWFSHLMFIYKRAADTAHKEFMLKHFRMA
jgi:hypothetical protein